MPGIIVPSWSIRQTHLNRSLVTKFFPMYKWIKKGQLYSQIQFWPERKGVFPKLQNQSRVPGISVIRGHKSGCSLDIPSSIIHSSSSLLVSIHDTQWENMEENKSVLLKITSSFHSSSTFAHISVHSVQTQELHRNQKAKAAWAHPIYTVN